MLKSNTLSFWLDVQKYVGKRQFWLCKCPSFSNIWQDNGGVGELENIEKLANDFLTTISTKNFEVSALPYALLFALTEDAAKKFNNEDRKREHYLIRVLFLSWVIDKFSE